MWDEILKNKQKFNKLTNTAFQAIDINSNHKIQQPELQQVMVSTAQLMDIQKPSKEEIKQLMKQLDKDNKGYLDKNDFSELVEQVLKIMKKNQQQ